MALSPMDSAEPEICYHVNARDEVVFVNSAWNTHAQSHGGAALGGDQVLGRNLWEFISDLPTRRLYEQIFARVRLGCPARFPLRCDTPRCKVLLDVNMRLLKNGHVEVSTAVRAKEDRPLAVLLRGPTGGSTEVLRSCAWCCRIDPGSGVWTSVEQATSDLQLFEQAAIPHLSHGICPDCFGRMTASIESMDSGAPDPAGDLGVLELGQM